MLASTVASILAFAALGARAVQVTTPDKSTIWKSGDSSDTVEWSVVSTDPSSFDVVLVNMASYPTSSTTLSKNVSASSGSITVSAPSGGFPVGNAYQINLLNSQSSAILAQSAQFNITESAASASSSSSTAASSSAASSSSTAASSSASKASSSSSASASSTSAASASAASASASASASTTSVEIPGASASTKSGAFSVVSLPSALLVAAIGLATITLV